MNGNGPHDEFLDDLNRHRAMLVKIAAAYARTADREDLVQEIAVQAWRAYPRFERRSKFSTWLYRIAMNVAISYQRRDERTRRRVVTADEPALERIAGTSEETADERLAQIYELIEALDPLDRALVLLYLDDRPYAEIAAILGITETNAGTRIGRIKERLKRDAAHTA
jgi:RNA polymerase sigma-70 factor (ECF subfamily)